MDMSAANITAIGLLDGAGQNGGDNNHVLYQIVGQPLGVFYLPHCKGLYVDENGTKAAAVSYAEGSYTANMPTGPIKFDHPFVYAIRENTTGTILFIGKVGQL